jgi:CHAT domain-containing protein
MAHASRDLAYAYSLAGDLANAEVWAGAALRYARRSPSTRDTTSVVGSAQKIAGDIAFRRGQIAKALVSYKAAMEVGPDWLRGMARVSLANAEIANRNFEAARQLLQQAAKGATEERLGYIRRGEAELAIAEGKHDEALRLYKAATTAGDAYSRMWAMRGMARVQRKVGRANEAIATYRQALVIGIELRAQFRSEEFKTGFFGELQTIYDEATGLLVETGASADGLEASEQGRARAMLDLIRGRVQVAGSGTGGAAVDPVGEAQSVAQIRAALAPNETIVIYHVLDSKTLVWTVTKDAVKVASIAVSRADLAKRVRNFRDLIQKKSPVASGTASRLHALLVAPAKLADGGRVVFVPHKSLHLLPFQALRGPKGWLVQERAVSIAPSASALVSLRRRAGDTQAGLLALGNPTSESGDPPLPGAEVEVRKIGTMVNGAEIFVGKEATKARFMSHAPAKGIVHIAAHSVVDQLDPLHSIVRLAPSPDGGGDLEAHEVYRLRLGATRMVVLSACDSGVGRISAGDEFWGFQRTFLGAGARTLLVTQWPVYDDSTPYLMERFYLHLQTNSPADALRKAQMDLIASGKYAEPVHWASFMVVGLPT